MASRYSQLKPGLTVNPMSVDDYSRAGIAKGKAQANLSQYVAGEDLSYNVDDMDQERIKGIVDDLEATTKSISNDIVNGTVTSATYDKALAGKAEKNKAFTKNGPIGQAQSNLLDIRINEENVKKMAVEQKWVAGKLEAQLKKIREPWEKSGGTFGPEYETTGKTNEFKSEYGPGDIKFEEYGMKILSEAAKNFNQSQIKLLENPENVIIHEPGTNGFVIWNKTNKQVMSNLTQLDEALKGLIGQLDDQSTLPGSVLNYYEGTGPEDENGNPTNFYNKDKIIEMWTQQSKSLKSHKTTGGQWDGTFKDNSALRPTSGTKKNTMQLPSFINTRTESYKPKVTHENQEGNVVIPAMAASQVYLTTTPNYGFFDNNEVISPQKREVALNNSIVEMNNSALRSGLEANGYETFNIYDEFYHYGDDPNVEPLLNAGAYNQYLEDTMKVIENGVTVHHSKTIDITGSDNIIGDTKEDKKYNRKQGFLNDIHEYSISGILPKGTKLLNSGGDLSIEQLKTMTKEGGNYIGQKMGTTAPYFNNAYNLDGDYDSDYLGANSYTVEAISDPNLQRVVYIPLTESDRKIYGLSDEWLSQEQGFSEMKYFQATPTLVMFFETNQETGASSFVTREVDVVKQSGTDNSPTTLVWLDYEHLNDKKLPARIPLTSAQIRDQRLLNLGSFENRSGDQLTDEQKLILNFKDSRGSTTNF